LAVQLHVPWTALHIESIRSAQLSDADRASLMENLRLAESLGGTAVIQPGALIAEAIVKYAHANEVTQIIVGRVEPSSWLKRITRSGGRGALWRDLASRAESALVQVVPLGWDATLRRRLHTRSSIVLWHFLLMTGVIGAMTWLGDTLRQSLDGASMAMMFMTSVVISAILFGLPVSLYASVLGIFCYDYFFTEPIYHFRIDSYRDCIALALFGVAAVATSHLAARNRAQMQLANTRAQIAAGLFVFSRELTGVSVVEQLLNVCVQTIGRMLHGNVAILLSKAGEMQRVAGFPEAEERDAAALEAAAAVWRTGAAPMGNPRGRVAGRWLFTPLISARGEMGVLGLSRGSVPMHLSDAERLLFDALADLAGLAIERAQLAEELDQARLRSATDQFRSSVLASLSHDLKTPLTSIRGALSSLQSFGGRFDTAAKADLIDTAHDEAERLARFVNNLLDLTRVESGMLSINADPVDIGELIGSAIRRTERVLDGVTVVIDSPDHLPIVPVDPVLIEQVIFNLIDNAAKYSPRGSKVVVKVVDRPSSLELSIFDEGSGIPPEDLTRIFEKFYRAKQGNRTVAGTGLGLAICKGFVEAHGGTITASNRNDRTGACFTIVLPKRAAEKPG
jgi:two-component system sensor histidine kinase KdpD